MHMYVKEIERKYRDDDDDDDVTHSIILFFIYILCFVR